MTRLSDIISRDEWTREDLAYAVGLEEGDPERELLSEAAHRVKAERVGCVSYYRGLIEFSNICVKNCLYCGIRKSHSSVHRFESTLDEILGIAKWTYENHYVPSCCSPANGPIRNLLILLRRPSAESSGCRMETRHHALRR